MGQIIQNSVKYAREENPRIEFSGKLIGEGSADERVDLTVSDNGCGVSASDVPRVFDKGFTGENGRTGKSEFFAEFHLESSTVISGKRSAQN